VVDQIGAPTWARHIAEATALIIQRACEERGEGEFASGIFNLTAGGATSWCGFAEAILDQAMDRQDMHWNRPKIRPIASSQYPQPAGRPKNSVWRAKRLRERFGLALPEWQRALALCMQDEALTEAL
jgi:dTDP-4-dehydrorhamnose reductase